MGSLPKTSKPRLVEAELHSYALPYHRAVRWESGEESSACFLLLRITDADGNRGAAEIVAKPFWNGFDVETLAFAFERLFLPLLKRQAADRDEALSRVVEMHAPKALIDNALFDLGASPAARAVPVSITLTRAEPEIMARQASDLIDRHGVGTLKVKGGQGKDIDISAIKAVHSAVGPGIGIYVDVNGALDYDQAPDYLTAMAELGILAVEDPCNMKPDPRLRILQEKSPVPIIVDFSVDGVSAAYSFLALGARGLSIKVSRFGMRKARAMGALAAKTGAVCVSGLFGESQAGALHVIDLHRSLPEAQLLPAEATSFLLMSEHILRRPMNLRDGELCAQDGNLAAQIDWQRVKRFSITEPKRWNLAT